MKLLDLLKQYYYCNTLIMYLILVVWFAGCMFQQTLAETHTNFEVKRVEVCSPSEGPIVLQYINITKREGKQYLNINFYTAIPLDENVGGTCLIQFAADGTHFLPLFKIQEKYMCKAANQYVGELWYDLERAAQLPPGACPIPARRYHIHNFHMDFKKLTLQTFPFGKLKFTIGLTDNKNSGKTLFCVVADIENVKN